MKVLLVEDNQEQQQFIAKGLSESGHSVDCADDGHMALGMALDNHYDVIVSDRMMPRLDGLQLIKMLRQSSINTPVLILSALDSVEERVKGLRSGGDDYLVKPFAFSELLARTEILAGRNAHPVESDEGLLRMDTLALNRLSRVVTRSGVRLALNNREFQILEYMLLNPKKVITRTMLLEQVWNRSFDPQTNVIDVHVSRLRKKVDPDSERRLLHTVRGMGYKLDDQE